MEKYFVVVNKDGFLMTRTEKTLEKTDTVLSETKTLGEAVDIIHGGKKK